MMPLVAPDLVMWVWLKTMGRLNPFRFVRKMVERGGTRRLLWSWTTGLIRRTGPPLPESQKEAASFCLRHTRAAVTLEMARDLVS
eukprot:19825_6